MGLGLNVCHEQLTWSTSPWVMGWVWKRALALRSRVSPTLPPASSTSSSWAFWGPERRLNRAIFSARLRLDRSGSSEDGTPWPSPPWSPPPPVGGGWPRWGARGSGFSFSWPWVRSWSRGVLWVLGLGQGRDGSQSTLFIFSFYLY